MAKKTYRQRYMQVYRNLQKELQKPIYSGTTQISIPKNIGKKQLERIQSISKEVKKTGKRVEKLQQRGYIFDTPPVQLPSRLTRSTVSRVQQITRPVDLYRQARYEKHVKGIPEYGLEPFTLSKTGLEGYAYERRLRAEKAQETKRSNRIRLVAEAWARENYSYDYADDYYPSTPIYEDDVTSEWVSQHTVDHETGEYIPKGKSREDFYKDNEFDVMYGDDFYPTEEDLAFDSLDKLLELLDDFDYSKGTPNPTGKAFRADIINSLKNDIEIFIETGDKEKIAQNIEDNWEEIADLIEDISYRTYADGLGQNNTEYDPIPDYNRVWSILNE